MQDASEYRLKEMYFSNTVLQRLLEVVTKDPADPIVEIDLYHASVKEDWVRQMIISNYCQA